MGVSTVSGPWGRPLAVRIKGFSGAGRPRRLKRKKGRDARMSLVIAQIINGLQTGSIFALVALGYSMVYGIILLLNFAHGDIIMVGAYMTFYAITTFHLHPLLSVVLAVVVSTLLGVVIEKVAYTPCAPLPVSASSLPPLASPSCWKTGPSSFLEPTPRAWTPWSPAT